MRKREKLKKVLYVRSKTGEGNIKYMYCRKNNFF